MRTVTGLQNLSTVLASVLLLASTAALRAALVALQASARTTTSAHGYRAAPGCVFSLGHPFIAPLTAPV